MGRKTIFFAVLTGVILIGLVGCVDKGKQLEKKAEVSATVESVAVSTQEMKTYMSKWGFSVSYPMGWYLKESKDIRGREERYWSIDFISYDADNQAAPNSQQGSWIDVSISIIDDAYDGVDKSLIPSDPYEKILALVKKHKYSNEGKDISTKRIKNDYDGCLIYYREDTPMEAIYYLPNKNVYLSIGLESDAGAKEFLSIVYSIRDNANKQ